MSEKAPALGHIKVMANVGHVCLQWSLLEHLVLSLIGIVEDMPIAKVYRIFSSLDMRPRCGMAINLMRDAKAPTYLVKRMEAVRTELQSGLDERRNQAVHGVHAFTGVDDSVQFTMPRWPEPKRTQTVTIHELFQLGTALNRLGEEVVAIGDEFFEWKQRVAQRRIDDLQSRIAAANAPALIKIAKHVRDRVQNWAGKLKA